VANEKHRAISGSVWVVVSAFFDDQFRRIRTNTPLDFMPQMCKAQADSFDGEYTFEREII